MAPRIVPPVLKVIESETMADKVYQQLREALMSGRFAPGQALSLRSVAEAVGSSTMPVRAALTRLRAAGKPILLTARAAAEGGRPMPEPTRRAIYEAGLDLADAIDVEIASTELAAALVPAAHRAGRTVILSTHDFETTPPRTEILARVARAFDAGADVAKVAAHAPSLAELRILIDVTRGVSPSPIVTLAMGPMGPLSRFVLSAAGSLLTYAAAGTPTAPGQLALDELAALFDRLLPR